MREVEYERRARIGLDTFEPRRREWLESRLRRVAQTWDTEAQEDPAIRHVADESLAFWVLEAGEFLLPFDIDEHRLYVRDIVPKARIEYMKQSLVKANGEA